MRPPLARQLALATCGVAAFAVLVSGLLALRLTSGAYDATARATLHRQAQLVAELVSRPTTSGAAGPRRPVGRLLAGSGTTVIRVLGDGRVLDRVAGATLPLDDRDTATAAAGQAESIIRRTRGQRIFVEVEPVGSDGGVVLLQRARDAQAPNRTVLRRLLLALLVGLSAAAVVGVLLAGRLARPLTRAADAARRLAAGDRDVRLPVDGSAEVADLARSLNALAGALATSEGRQRDFLMSVSHELRTPLTAVRGFAEALADGVATGPEAVRAGVVLQAESARLQRLVDDLLDLARLDADDFRLDLTEVDLRSLLTDAGDVWGHRCAAVGVELRLELPARPVVVRTDAVRLRQVVDGLAENALRVTPSGRPLVLSVTEQAVLQVRDGGPGLTDEDLAVAFDRGALHDLYKGVRQVGTGLGLALVARLVQRLGGSVSAGHAPEGGAAFTVRLTQT